MMGKQYGSIVAADEIFERPGRSDELSRIEVDRAECSVSGQFEISRVQAGKCKTPVLFAERGDKIAR
jgi:hypothetical protein